MIDSYKEEPILIDCTLRDGGYYNKWDFNYSLVNKYLNAVSSAGIDFVEIGFRTLKNNEYLGPLAYCTEDYLRDLKFKNSTKIGVMINSSEIKSDENFYEIMNRLFPVKAPHSKVSLVRIATTLEDLKNAIRAGKWLKNQGYIIGINLMQIATLNINEIKKFASEFKNFKPNVLFFADSTGTLKTENIDSIIKSLRLNWMGDIGIHAHDNMHRALINTLEAHNKGVKWLDSTVNGLGRGPGNTKTEDLVFELKKINDSNIDFLPLIDLIQNDFAVLKEKYKWGSNPFYFLSGKNKIHPTYIQNMLNDNSYRNEDIYASIKELSKQKSNLYEKSKLEKSRNYYSDFVSGSWSPKSVFLDKEVLLIAPGNSINNHKKNIEKFIVKKKPIVIVLNNLETIKEDFVNYRIACHPLRIFTDLSTYKNFSNPLIAPLSSLKKWSENNIEFQDYDYGLQVKENTFEYHDKFCILPYPLVMAYALATLNAGNSKLIYLAGFDGYKSGDKRSKQVEHIWDLYNRGKNNTQIISLTETAYNINKGSLYSFL